MINRLSVFGKTRAWLLILPIALLAGCATSEHGARNLSDVGRYTQLQKSVTTKKDVFISFGQPHDVQYAEDHASFWRYYQAKTSSNVATFIPFVGLLAGGVNSSTMTATIFFDQEGKYQNLTTKDVSKSTNMWAGMARGSALAKEDKKGERVKLEMDKMRLPFDEQIAKKMAGIEIFSED